jgi:hypothetical protein
MQKMNPFSDYGGIVTKDRFVGRKTEIELIRGRLLGENSYGNLAIMGLPRIGKSSLGWNSIMAKKESLLKRNIIPVWISLGEFSDLFECFHEVLEHILETIESDKKQSIDNSYEEFIKRSKALEKRRFLKKFFRSLKAYDYRIIIIFDEFDNAKNIFSLQDFQFLRELSYNPETKIGILTISRKSVQEIEPDEGILSNFYQIFSDLNLNLFNENDLAAYWERTSGFGLNISESYKDKVYNLVGHHPYLLDLLNSQVYTKINETGLGIDQTIDESFSILKLKVFNEYESVINLMKHEHLDRMMTQMIVGPVYDITQRDIERLLKYGIVIASEEDSYLSFSPYFSQYLHLKSHEIQIWPLWNEVETEVRSLIKTHLSNKYGDEWEDSYRKEYKNKNGKVDILDGNDYSMGLIKEKMRSKKLFGNLASDHLIDYTLPRQMFDNFISKDWIWYGQSLGGNKGDWKQVFDHLSKIRNPLAHNNPNFLSSSDKSLAEGYCKKILDLIISWRNSKI